MPPNRSARAEMAAAEVPLCPDCPPQSGLCASCAVTVLPQLKQPSWHQDAHRGEHHVAGVNAPTSAEGERVKRRKASRARTRLLRALRGEHTRVSRA
jgi:hypothetical protein